MFQPMFASFPYSQIGMPFNFVELTTYIEGIQSQIKDLEEKLEDLTD